MLIANFVDRVAAEPEGPASPKMLFFPMTSAALAHVSLFIPADL
jgi:hypothetical protein